MFSLFLHLIILVLAGVALFVLWQKTISSDRWINLVIAIGFLVRAILGQALFWISYGRLPIARSLQMGDGFWFFAVDALQYYPQALRGAHDGIWAIVNFPREMASVSFVQVLSASVLLFGEVASVALLLNLFCFLGTSYLIVRWAAHYEHARIAARLAITAIALSPAFIIWSVQPLKDTFFTLLVVALVVSCVAWQRAWISSAAFWWRTVIALAICTDMYLVAGIRWYFAFVLLIALCGFALLVAFRAVSNRTTAFGSALVLLIALSRAFLFGGSPYVPDSIRGILTLNADAMAAVGVRSSILGDVESARSRFERSGGSTQIRLGSGLAWLDQRSSKSVATRPDVTPRRYSSAPSQTPEKSMVLLRIGRFAAGAAAVLVPGGIGQRIGMFQIGGGRNLWWFSDFDTLIFDLVAFAAIFWFVQSTRLTSLRNPMFWLIAVLTLLIGLPLVYSVSNFGTLFRLREMIYLGLMLIPLALATAPPGPSDADGSSTR